MLFRIFSVGVSAEGVKKPIVLKLRPTLQRLQYARGANKEFMDHAEALARNSWFIFPENFSTLIYKLLHQYNFFTSDTTYSNLFTYRHQNFFTILFHKWLIGL